MKIPSIGLGTWKLSGDECERIVRQALELGYRHIDTADAYENHHAVGKAIRSFPREQLFLTTKLWFNDLVPERVHQATARFLDELQVPYIDLLLIHWPSPDVNLIETLQDMVKLKQEGVIREIGISNFVRFHLKELAPHHFPILTNQIELHPYYQRRPLVKACEEAKIIVTAYRPAAQGAFEEDPVMQKIGKKYGKSPTQIALKWIHQQGMVVIPKAANPKHLKENLAILDFTLDAADMKAIDALDCGKRLCAPEGFPVYDD